MSIPCYCFRDHKQNSEENDKAPSNKNRNKKNKFTI